MLKSVGFVQPSVSDQKIQFLGGSGKRCRNGHSVNGNSEQIRNSVEDNNSAALSTKSKFKIKDTAQHHQKAGFQNLSYNSNIKGLQNYGAVKYKDNINANSKQSIDQKPYNGNKAKSCINLSTIDTLPSRESANLSADNKIRIKITYDNDHKANRVDKLCTKPTANVNHLNGSYNFSSDKNGITRIKTYGSCISLTNATTYNEKAIDVPEDFERAAYANAIRNNSTGNINTPFRRLIRRPIHLNPTLRDFLQEEWIKVDEKLNTEDIQSINNQNNQSINPKPIFETMGVKCSKNLRKFGKHSVAPKQDTDERIKSSKSYKDKAISTNPFEENAGSSGALETNLDKSDSCGYLFSSNYYTPRPSFGSIDENSIMHRSSEIYSAGKRGIIRDHFNYYKDCPTSRNLSKDIYRNRANNFGESSTNASNSKRNLYHRLGGSIQNLVGSSSLSKKFSASDSNLNRIRSNSSRTRNNRGRFSSENGSSDYCPSGLFNRFSVLKRKNSGNTEKSKAFTRWKKFLNANVLRKKEKRPNARKT